MIRALWAVLMLAWLAGLVWGARGLWPLVAAPAVTAELAMGLAWLIMGAAAWLLALRLGLQRYWGR